ncbi:MAG TPA: TIM-barrel domain-containing protein [Candidatus Acidoferrum sp.]|nr:TIM-barrel domain-containing protein [Candidatus Acidoferrum sp.]
MQLNFARLFRSARVAALGATLWFPASLAHAKPTEFISGNVRVQCLSGALVRLELKGPQGFENRKTFHVINRDWPGAAFTAKTVGSEILLRTTGYVVYIPQNAQSLRGVRIEAPEGRTVYAFDGQLENSRWLPGPAEKPAAWAFADTPRLVPPPWGLTPPPRNQDTGSQPPTDGGWDLANNAPDIYVFLPGGDYRRLRADFLKLTGPTEMMPLYGFGAFDSRWYDYNEASALQQVEDYRARRLPLDVLVVDTGWRAGASTGYQPNTNLFPDLPRFFQAAHAKNVRVLFNDHPEPLSTNVTGLETKELNYRFDGLAGLLRDGLDIWWYDRNWWVALVPPAPGLRKEVWGMRLYHDTTARVRPEDRPTILANVDGIDNGIRQRPMDVAAHRFPFQWTGDIGPGWDFLRRAVENAVYSGIQSLFPYESDDLGGHTSNPTPEQYIRWIEYGALSPIYRPHCTHNLKRMPWAFGPEAENVARRFVNLRYRLLPVLYAAAHENYETGEPLLRRLDLDYPDHAEAGRDDEYLLGKFILVAPVLQGALQTVPATWLKTPDGQPGLQAEFFTNVDLSGPPALTRTDAIVSFDWSRKTPAPGLPAENYTARWTGAIEVPAAAGDILLATVADDGARVWIDDQLVIDAWGPHALTTSEASAVLTAGQPHRLRIEYLQLGFDAALKLQWRSLKSGSGSRSLWVPPGNWLNAWTGDRISGPAMVTNEVPLGQIPIYLKAGAVVPLAPEMPYTGQKPWDPITLDLYPRAGQTNTATLYEDDTLSVAYQRGKFRNTVIAATADEAGKTVSVKIGKAAGKFNGALKQRAWILRIHAPANWPKDLTPAPVKVNGKQSDAPVRRLNRDAAAMPLGDPAGAPDGNVFEVSLPAARTSRLQAVEVRFAPAN